MKRVPTGHDSPWVAAEAIGREVITIKDEPTKPGVRPSRHGVIALPVLAGDGSTPPFTCAVLAFGVNAAASTLESRSTSWVGEAEAIIAKWGERISSVAFPAPGPDARFQ